MKIEHLLENESPSITHHIIDSFSEKVKNDLNLERFDLYLKKNGDVELAMLETPKDERSSGKGTEAMEKLISFADNKGFRIVLTPDIIDGSGTTSVKRLVAFYKRFGFVENKGRNKIYTIRNLMYRNPK